MSRQRVLALPDKFRGTATAAEVAETIATAARAAGWRAQAQPVADGGEGLLLCFGAPNRRTRVAGPLGEPLEAAWLQLADRAVIEMAAASGHGLTAGIVDPVRADTRGTGELVAAAIGAGVATIVVGAGGSASTDGGWAAVEQLRALAPLDGTRGYLVEVAVDVSTGFLDAARVFGPQKGADAGQVETLTERLRAVAERYRTEFGVDVTSIAGAGAAGGLAGGLAALGARVRPGFALVAEHLGLAAHIARADLVITGEGRFDGASMRGKAPGEVITLCRAAGVPVALIVGAVADGVDPGVATISLTEAFSRDAALADTLACIGEATRLLLARYSIRPASPLSPH
jgi:glycerate kinase